MTEILTFLTAVSIALVIAVAIKLYTGSYRSTDDGRWGHDGRHL